MTQISNIKKQQRLQFWQVAVERRPGCFGAKEAIICTFRTDLKVVPLCWAMLLCPSIPDQPPFYQGKSWPDSSFQMYEIYIKKYIICPHIAFDKPRSPA